MKQAVILAAGEGRRLKPFTINKPKAMIAIAGKPIIQYVIESLAANGIRDIIIVVGYQKEKIFDYIGEGKQFGVEIRYVNQDKQIGTADALAHARGLTDKEFLVLSGNRLISPETLAPIIKASPPAVVIKRVENPSRYGVVELRDGKMLRIVEKPANPSGDIINAGIYSFNERVFNYMELELNFPEVLNNMIEAGEPFSAIETPEMWEDTVYPWDILSLNATILQKTSSSQNGVIEPNVTLKGPVFISPGTIIRSNSYIAGPVMIGKGCEIGPNVCIFPASSIANNVVISPFSEIRNSIIGDDVSIASGAIIQDSVIDEGCVIGPQFNACSGEADVKVDDEHHTVKIGIMMGRSCRLGSTVVAEAGTIIGNYSQIKSLKSLNGNFADKSLVV
jgi:UDP-N-acetylglucosamine diphosphorylase / glucose-1-phosphate thymidylyltransferase / UDP-N-acetylgalactosamine diphosphorylase / glucosamine-1-phosphate N-acetyltransferase / galactosamine-1-phosphate N-acetyltransferase